jgi:phosphoribosylformylglycinamidine synthase I
MKFGVLVFPGSNCDHDAYHALKHEHGIDTTFIWHKDTELGDVDGVIIPGGFSYGDYLRSGAIARFSPVMNAVAGFAAKGGPVLGICNGFQILLEAQLLPGTMMANEQLRFTCKFVNLVCQNRNTPFTAEIPADRILSIPVAHGEGNYYADGDLLKKLEDQPDRRPLLQCKGRDHAGFQPQRFYRKYRRHLQRQRKRSRHDAASGAGSRRETGICRRTLFFRVRARTNRISHVTHLGHVPTGTPAAPLQRPCQTV